MLDTKDGHFIYPPLLLVQDSWMDRLLPGSSVIMGSFQANIKETKGTLISGNGKVSNLAKLRDPLVENSIANEENFQDFNSPEGMSGSAIIIS